ncbi:AMP-binding protein [Flavobacterium tegetincola]|uniref:AMP-binding protein n=1 Tax=Flavobacterium tegetincola TaxID=150172 RepID=UPI0003FD5F7B|nr:AMP-binding protein [Flavobacterium tegetincola]
MKEPTYLEIHPKFKLNGHNLSKDDLYIVAYSYIKEGNASEKGVGQFLLDWLDDHPYIEMHTSGSTGIPKLIRVSKQSMVNSAIASGKFFDLQAGAKILNCLPMKYVAGKMMFVRSFVLGLEMDFVPPSLQPLLKVVKCYDFCAMVPLQAQNSLKELHLIKQLIVGGAKINAKLEKQLLKLKKTACYETFGMTETVSHIAAKKVGEKNFRLMPNISITADERNCLIIDAPKLLDYPIITNDVVEIVEGNQFRFLGRLDNVINSGGVKINPELVEEKLVHKISPRFMIYGKPDTDLGEKVVLLIESDPFALDDVTFNVLEKYERPKEIHFLKQFKDSSNGKLLRKETITLI